MFAITGDGVYEAELLQDDIVVLGKQVHDFTATSHELESNRDHGDESDAA